MNNYFNNQLQLGNAGGEYEYPINFDDWLNKIISVVPNMPPSVIYQDVYHSPFNPSPTWNSSCDNYLS